MYKLLCISNRRLCGEKEFINRIQEIIDFGIPVILREKDLTERQYYDMLCSIDRKNIIAHTYAAAARNFGCTGIHLPMPLLECTDISGFDIIGASTHSLEEAQHAQERGTSYITAGHVFATDCKKGLKPRGTGLIRDICSDVHIPVYALGGISPENALSCIHAGAYGVSIMSGFMQCGSIKEYAGEYKHIL